MKRYTFGEAKESIQKSIENFRLHLKEYKSNTYNEANTRVYFIDKIFTLLDCDVRNIGR